LIGGDSEHSVILNNMIYYCIIYGPFYVIYWHAKKHLLLQPILPLQNIPSSSALVSSNSSMESIVTSSESNTMYNRTAISNDRWKYFSRFTKKN
jgi:hypothetical protein